MTYSQVFGGGTINPSERTYLSLVTAVDVTLNWPLNTVATDNVAADIIDVDATAPGVDITLSDARQVSNGFTSLFTNVGSNNYQVLDALGATIVSPGPGEAWFVYLTDNSTEGGTWSTFQLGATVSVASAAALAGAGIKAITTTLNQSIPPTLTAATPINWADANRALFTIWTGGVGVLNLPTPVSVGSDWFGLVRNEGSGTLTVTPAAGQVDSAATLVLNPGDSIFLVTDGTDFYSIGLGGSTTVGFDFVQIDVSGSGNFTLTGVQLNRISYQFTGALTGNRTIIVPNTIQQYWVDNSTTGAFSLFIQTAAQITPVEVTQGNRSILYCDGTDVVDAETGTFTPPVGIAQGGTGAITAPTAVANLGALPVIVDLASVAPASGDFLAFQDIDDADNNKRATIADIVAAAGGSNAQISGVPVNNQLAVWVNGTDIEGDANLTFSGGAAGVLSTPNITGGATELSVTGYDENDDGLVLEDGMRLTFEDLAFANDVYLRNEGVGGGSGTLTMRTDSSANLVLAGPGFQLNNSALTEPVNLSLLTATVRRANFSQAVRAQGPIYLVERATANSDFAGDGQIWIENSVANRLMFTDDVGTDMTVACSQFIFKSANETVNNSSTFQDDNDFTGLQMDAGATYRVRMGLLVSQASAVPDFKVQLVGEGAGTLLFLAGGAMSQPDGGVPNIGDAGSLAGGFVDTSVGDNWIHVEFIATVGNDDTFKVQWAQQTANASNTTLQDRSYIEVTKIAG